MSILFDHEEGTDQPHGERSWFLRRCAASGDYRRMPLVWFGLLHTTGALNITRVRHLCTTFVAQVEAMYKPKSSSHCCLLCARCVKWRKSRIKNQSHRLFHVLNLFFSQFSSVSDCHDHIIRYNLSLPGIPESEICKKLHSFVAPTMFPRRDMRADQRNMFLDEDQKGEKRKGGTSAARRVSSKARSGQMLGSASGDPMLVMDSPSTSRWSERLRDSLTHRLERVELLNDHRDELLLQCVQSRRLLEGFLWRTWLVEGDIGLVPTVRSSQGAGKGIQRGGERAKGAPDGTTLHVGVCSVRQCPGDGESWSDRAGRDRGGVAAPISQAAHLGFGCGPVSRDVEHLRDPSERGTSANSGKVPDANARPCPPRGHAEYQQAGTHSPQSPSPSKGDRTGRPGTTDEQRAKNTESTRAAPQDEIDIYETDLAESMAIWGFGEDDEEHTSLQ